MSDYWYFHRTVTIGTYAYGVLYLIGVFALAWHNGRDLAMTVAVLAAGAAYCAQLLSEFVAAKPEQVWLLRVRYAVHVSAVALAILALLGATH